MIMINRLCCKTVTGYGHIWFADFNLNKVTDLGGNTPLQNFEE